MTIWRSAAWNWCCNFCCTSLAVDVADVRLWSYADSTRFVVDLRERTTQLTVSTILSAWFLDVQRGLGKGATTRRRPEPAPSAVAFAQFRRSWVVLDLTRPFSQKLSHQANDTTDTVWSSIWVRCAGPR